MEVRQVTVITANPTRSDDVGSCAEGFYTIDGDTITMCDSEGVPLRDSNNGERVTARLSGEPEKVIAKRLTLKRHRAENGDDANGFGKVIHYERWVY
jgi:hypothetical protein